MSLGIIGKKIGMTHRFDEKGRIIPLTVVLAGPCPIIQKKTKENDNYDSIQMGFEDVDSKKVSKPLNGHFKKSKVTPKRFLKEVTLSEEILSKYNEGDSITVADFENCKYIDITGTSKGRGYTGVIKRHGFHMPKMTHGTHEKFRHGGSLGCRFPQRVFKGKKMAGQYGNENITVQNLEVYSVIKEDNLILIKGSVPGPNNRIVFIKEALKRPATK